MGKAVEISDDSFDAEVIKADVPVMVDFWAPWCGPCKMVAPILEEIATEFDGKLKIAKMDVDQNPEIARQFKIMSIPSLLIFKEGKLVDQVVGALPKAQLLDRVNKVIG